jgi:putative DNA primase/helicase
MRDEAPPPSLAAAAIEFRAERERRELARAVPIRPNVRRPRHAPPDIPPPTEDDGLGCPSDARPPAFSDEALALLFAERHAFDLRFVAAWGKWLSWAGDHWRFDDTLHAFDLARRICREVAAGCNKAKVASAIASSKTVAAVERLVKADRRLAATVDQWDAEPWLLNTPDGVIDLQTGRRRVHNPDDHMTKIAAVGPRGDCPRFLAFLDRILGGDDELVAYIRRVLGYGLTGLTREHALFFGYGTGANGKSVLLATVAGIMGDYHRSAPIETFTASNADRHPTDLAGLRGARLVTATETEDGRRWAESKVKQLTGGDTIAARFMRQDFFEYKPAFKLFIAGNHKPSLRSVDEAIRRRFHLVPFAVTIPPEERDGELTEKLKAEWPGILAWMIEGVLMWQTEGLRPPKAVIEATEAYMAAEDATAAWIDDKCERSQSSWEPLSGLFASWVTWAEASGEYAGSAKRLSQTLEDKGFLRHKMTAGQGFYGLRIIVPQDDVKPYWNR